MKGSEAPSALARGICGKAKRNCAEANPASHCVLPPFLQLRRDKTPQSPVAIPPRAAARSILAKASENVQQINISQYAVLG